MPTSSSLKVINEVSSKCSLGFRSNSEESLQECYVNNLHYSMASHASVDAGITMCSEHPADSKNGGALPRNSSLHVMNHISSICSITAHSLSSVDSRDYLDHDHRAMACSNSLNTILEMSSRCSLGLKSESTASIDQAGATLARDSLDVILHELRKSASRSSDILAAPHRDNAGSDDGKEQLGSDDGKEHGSRSDRDGYGSVESTAGTEGNSAESVGTSSTGHKSPVSTEDGFSIASVDGSRSSFGQSLEEFGDAEVEIRMPAQKTPHDGTGPFDSPEISSMSPKSSDGILSTASYGVTVDDFEDALERLKSLNAVDDEPAEESGLFFSAADDEWRMNQLGVGTEHSSPENAHYATTHHQPISARATVRGDSPGPTFQQQSGGYKQDTTALQIAQHAVRPAACRSPSPTSTSHVRVLSADARDATCRGRLYPVLDSTCTGGASTRGRCGPASRSPSVTRRDLVVTAMPQQTFYAPSGRKGEPSWIIEVPGASFTSVPATRVHTNNTMTGLNSGHSALQRSLSPCRTPLVKHPLYW
eukprot:gnl/TRDRNA2_/TRDRNA2_85839_c1_seq1.p1 gnl/TRDRNA2_/TRDRNA2_85839_c1~~gnl/TRDRNA2_/TRDRNA2_85839_c1_seq1.p1  ORF type:complete len:557 (+),score=73.61 gnl/TRDRNA2_/TRDRNA2_85839_c1_seq1:68-1672(+)